MGWIRFDPTPAGPRETAENTRLTEARQNGAEDVDVAGTNNSATTPAVADGEVGEIEVSEGVTPAGANPSSGGDANLTRTATTQQDRGSGAGSDSSDDTSWLPSLPSTRALLVGAVALVGVTAGAYRTGTVTRTAGLLAAQFQRRRDPDTDAVRAYLLGCPVVATVPDAPEPLESREGQRAYRRLAVLLERRSRPRRPGETPRAYVESVATGRFDSPDVHRVVELYERAQYGDGVDPEAADEAVATVDRLVRSATPVVRRFR